MVIKLRSLVPFVTYQSLKLPSGVARPPLPLWFAPSTTAVPAASRRPRCRVHPPPRPPLDFCRCPAPAAATAVQRGFTWPSLPPPAAASAAGRRPRRPDTDACPVSPLPQSPSSPNTATMLFPIEPSIPPPAATVRLSPLPVSSAATIGRRHPTSMLLPSRPRRSTPHRPTASPTSAAYRFSVLSPCQITGPRHLRPETAAPSCHLTLLQCVPAATTAFRTPPNSQNSHQEI